MKHYPSIDKKVKSTNIYAFDKLDGSNISAEWSRKKKFYKFGSKTRLLGSDQSIICNAKDLIISKYEKDLSDIFTKNRTENATCFFEFFGPNSFAGQHSETDKHDVVLFEVYKKIFLPPKEYLDLVGHLDIAKLLYHGPPHHEFIMSVKDSTLDGITFEGVVCKAKDPKSNNTAFFKVKTNAWLNKLKEYCGNDENKFKELE